GDTLISNVFAGSPQTKVEYALNGGEWVSMKASRRPAESVLKLIEWNRSKAFPASGRRVTPLRKSNSPHIWEAVLPHLPEGVHHIRVRAYDEYGFAAEVQESLFLTPRNL